MSRLIVPLVLSAIVSTPAFAITCHGDFQIVGGQEISTPYCRDASLAAVARAAGYHVTDSTVRENAARKEELCRHLNTDIRAQPASDDVLPAHDDD